MSVDFLPFRAPFRAQSGRLSTLNLYAGENPRSFYADGVARVPAPPECLQLLEHSGATGEYIAVGGVEIAGVPGVGHVAGAIGPIEQARDLAIGVLPKNSVQAAGVRVVHIDIVVPVAILRATHLTCAMCDDGNPDLAQLRNGTVVRRVADLLGRGRSGINDKLARAPGAVHQLGKHRLGHRRAADVPMADKQYTLHRTIPFYAVAQGLQTALEAVCFNKARCVVYLR